MVVVITAGNYDMLRRDLELGYGQVLINYIFPAAGMTDVTFIATEGSRAVEMRYE